MKLNENFHFLYGLFSCNVGIIISGGEIALVDSGWTNESVDLILSYIDMIKKSDDILKYVFMTHADHDHIGGLYRLKKKYDAKIVIHEAETERLEKPEPPILPSTADISINKDTIFKIGDLELQLIVTPGHTPGSTCIYNKEQALLFSGDTVAYNLQDFYWPCVNRFLRIPRVKGDEVAYVNSLKRLLNLKIKCLLPGHGRPILDAKKIIREYIQITEQLKDRVYDILREKLSPSELVEKIGALFPADVEKIIEELLKEGKVEQVGEKALRKEPVYKRIN